MIVSNSEFYDIIQDKTGIFQYETFVDGKNMKIVGVDFPLGIKPLEFDYIKNTVEYYGLKSGFEIGTGLGISATAAGLGFKKTKGRLITLDSYVEETVVDSNSYENFKPKIFEGNIGFNSIKHLIKKFNLFDNVFPEKGWSPDDVPSIIQKHSIEKIDYVFIDGGHFKEQLLKDLKCLIPYLDENFVLLFHDCTTKLIDEEVHQFFFDNFRRTLRMVYDKPHGDWLCSIIKF